MTMDLIDHLTLDAERALYGIQNTIVRRCTFDGPADGESALKECRGITVEDCLFRLRYPFWHVTGATICRITMEESCRAALWYDRDVEVFDSNLGGIKAFREMDNCSLTGCRIDSKEFGWFCRGLRVQNSTLVSEYPFFQCKNMEIDGLHMKAKYSFQYCEDITIRNSTLDTKDAFWHSKNVTVYDSIVKGEYLAWYSENLRLVRCKIIGTQPLCYCKGLILEDCTMEGCDLSFENSEVRVAVRGSIDSVKNPHCGYIRADSIGAVILDEYKWDGECQIHTA